MDSNETIHARWSSKYGVPEVPHETASILRIMGVDASKVVDDLSLQLYMLSTLVIANVATLRSMAKKDGKVDYNDIDDFARSTLTSMIELLGKDAVQVATNNVVRVLDKLAKE